MIAQVGTTFTFSQPKLSDWLTASSPAHRELGLADLEVTAFWKKGIEGGTTEVQKKVVPLSKMEGEGEDDKNKRMFGFNLEAAVWLIEVKSTALSFASYLGNFLVLANKFCMSGLLKTNQKNTSFPIEITCRIKLPINFFLCQYGLKELYYWLTEIELTAEMVDGTAPIEAQSIQLGEVSSLWGEKLYLILFNLM